MKSLSTIVLSIFMMAFLASCGGESPETVDATEPAEPAAESNSEEAVAYSVNTDQSIINWVGAKKLVDSKHTGTIALQGGSLKAEEGSLKAGNFTIDMSSIVNTDLEDPDRNAKLVGHLKSPDFFDVEKFPTSTFEVTNITKAEGEGATHNITGNLTMKDETKSITFPANVVMEDGQLRATAKFAIDRSQWNVKYGSESFFDNLGDKAIKNEIQLELTLVADKASA